MAKGNYSQKKEKKKPKKNQKVKGNPRTGSLPGRTYPGTIMPFPDLPRTGNI